MSEPAGARSFEGEVTVGGTGSDIVVPGCSNGPYLSFAREDSIWHVSLVGGAAPRVNVARIDGALLEVAQDLRAHDVVSLGDAQIVVSEVTRTLLSLDVRHLVGNQTVSPATVIAELPPRAAVDEWGFTDVPIRAAPLPAPRERTPQSTLRAWRRRLLWRIVGAAALVITLIVLTGVTSVTLDVIPSDAAISTPGTMFRFRTGARLYLLSGAHVIRAERSGYRPAQLSFDTGEEPQVVHLRLLKLPGALAIDTHGVQATALIDGVEAGRVPGRIVAPAGTHTLLVRAARYLDHIQSIAVAGANQTQRLSVSLEPSWGTIVAASDPSSARVQIDGAESGITPATLDLPAGIHEVSLIAPGYRSWRSSVVVRPGERLAIGPVALGAPDAQVTVRSQPGDAEVSIAGRYRGRTPTRVALAPGVAYEVSVSLPGKAAYTKTIQAEAGADVFIDAVLTGSPTSVLVSGDPSGADVWVDGAPRGIAPQSLMLEAVAHRIEVRKAGYQTYSTTVVPSAGLARQILYNLGPGEHAIALKDSAAIITAHTGYPLRLMRGGSPDNTALRRAFYIGIDQVTNADFQRFRAAHNSGPPGARSLDRSDQPVVQVSWDEAAEFCNWLSGEDGLPPAYVAHDGAHTLKRPATTGYRLPTEAEWNETTRGSHDSPGVSEWMNDSDGNKHLIRTASTRDAAAGAAPTLGFRIARYAEEPVQ